MNNPFISERKFALKELEKTGLDLEAAYIAVGRLQYLAQNQPETVNQNMVLVLGGVLTREEFVVRRTSYFLYRKAANALLLIIVHCPCSKVRKLAFEVLKKLISAKDGPVHRAAAEALGTLPLCIHGPGIAKAVRKNFPKATWSNVLDVVSRKTGEKSYSDIKIRGRSLCFAMKNQRVLVVKLARADDSPDSLHTEAAWMLRLRQEARQFKVLFHVPEPVQIQGSHVFKLQNAPKQIANITGLHPDGLAMAFVAHAGYFNYPNDNAGQGLPDSREFLKILGKNAWLLGRLTAFGMVHTAPIPLFHNRIQAGRRTDHGIYQWPRQGRLDKWLDSCRYPNLGATGLRDFEHILAFKGSMRELYLYMGTHVLSLVLVAGSYFRNKAPQRVGLDGNGQPVDARDLFDRFLFIQAIREIFFGYYNGFVNRKFSGVLPRDDKALADAMIREMGVDQYMDEILRIHDQERMTHDQFVDFLTERGFTKDQARRGKKGAADITIQTGPHLGGFNDTISLPELICFVATAASLCVAGKYMEQSK